MYGVVDARKGCDAVDKATADVAGISVASVSTVAPVTWVSGTSSVVSVPVPLPVLYRDST